MGTSPCPCSLVGQLTVAAGTRQRAGWCGWDSEGALPLWAVLGGQMSSAQSSACAGGVLGYLSHQEPPGGRQKPGLASQWSLGGPQGSDGSSELAVISNSAGAWPSMAFLYLGMLFWTGRSAAPGPGCSSWLCITAHRRRGCQHGSPRGGPGGAKDLAVEEEVGREGGVRCSVRSMDKRHGQQSQPADGMNRCALCGWTRVGAAGEGRMSQAAECLCGGSFTSLAPPFPQPRGDLLIYPSRP